MNIKQECNCVKNEGSATISLDIHFILKKYLTIDWRSFKIKSGQIMLTT